MGLLYRAEELFDLQRKVREQRERETSALPARCANRDGRFRARGLLLCGTCMADDWKNYYIRLAA